MRKAASRLSRRGGWAIDAARRAVIFDAALASQKRTWRHFFGRGRAASATVSPTFIQKTEQPALRLACVPGLDLREQ